MLQQHQRTILVLVLLVLIGCRRTRRRVNSPIRVLIVRGLFVMLSLFSLERRQLRDRPRNQSIKPVRKVEQSCHSTIAYLRSSLAICVLIEVTWSYESPRPPSCERSSNLSTPMRTWT